MRNALKLRCVQTNYVTGFLKIKSKNKLSVFSTDYLDAQDVYIKKSFKILKKHTYKILLFIYLEL